MPAPWLESPPKKAEHDVISRHLGLEKYHTRTNTTSRTSTFSICNNNNITEKTTPFAEQRAWADARFRCLPPDRCKHDFYGRNLRTPLLLNGRVNLFIFALSKYTVVGGWEGVRGGRNWLFHSVEIFHKYSLCRARWKRHIVTFLGAVQWINKPARVRAVQELLRNAPILTLYCHIRSIVYRIAFAVAASYMRMLSVSGGDPAPEIECACPSRPGPGNAVEYPRCSLKSLSLRFAPLPSVLGT